MSGELILPGDPDWSTMGSPPNGVTKRTDYERGRADALAALNQVIAANPAIGRTMTAEYAARQIDFTIDQGPGDEPVSSAYVAGARSVIPSAKVVWNDGDKITVIDEGRPADG